MALFKHSNNVENRLDLAQAMLDKLERNHKLILSSFIGGCRKWEKGETKHHQSSVIRAFPYIVHNLIKALLALTLTIEVLLRKATLALRQIEQTGIAKYPILISAFVLTLVYLITRIMNTALSLILESIAICQ